MYGAICYGEKKYGFNDRIISIEPVTKAYKLLVKNSLSDSNWEALNIAAGDFDGQGVINIAGNLQSSSFLWMLPALANAHPESKYVGKQKAEVRKLDSILPELVDFSKENCFLKIDARI